MREGSFRGRVECEVRRSPSTLPPNPLPEYMEERCRSLTARLPEIFNKSRGASVLIITVITTNRTTSIVYALKFSLFVGEFGLTDRNHIKIVCRSRQPPNGFKQPVASDVFLETAFALNSAFPWSR